MVPSGKRRKKRGERRGKREEGREERGDGRREMREDNEKRERKRIREEMERGGEGVREEIERGEEGEREARERRGGGGREGTSRTRVIIRIIIVMSYADNEDNPGEQKTWRGLDHEGRERLLGKIQVESLKRKRGKSRRKVSTDNSNNSR